MAGTLISSFWNGDATTNSLTAIQQTLIRLYRKHNEVAFGNYAKGNTSMLTVLSGSSVVVNMNFFFWPSTESILLLKADGSTSSMDTAAAAEYYIIAVINGDKTCSIYARDARDVTVARNQSFAGWYITNSQHRVLGGVTKNSDGTYGRKWVYQTSEYANEGVSPTFRLYADGLCYTPLTYTDKILVNTDTTTMDHYTTPVVLYSGLVITQTATVLAEIYGKARVAQAYNDSKGTPTAMGVLSIVDEDNAACNSTTIIFRKNSANYKLAATVQPGTYSIVLTPSTSSETVSNMMNTNYGTNIYAITTSLCRVQVKNVVGKIDGTY